MRINLKGATRSWAGTAFKQQRYLAARGRDETPYEKQSRLEKMANPRKILAAWIAARTKQLYPRAASLNGQGLTIDMRDNLDIQDIKLAMALVFVTEDGRELTFKGIGTDTFTEGGQWNDDPESTYAMLTLTYA